jgi:hypothetical protein
MSAAGTEDERRARLWLRSLAGNSASVREARRLRLSDLCAVTERQAALAESVVQINKDLPRLAVREDKRERVREVLMAWLALNNFVGYAQGMDMMCSVLLGVYERGRSAAPSHDALASLSAVARVNSDVVPLHATDGVPLRQSCELAERIWTQVSSAAPSLQAQLYAVLPQLQVFVLRALPPCFGNVVGRREALVCLWDYVLVASAPVRSARCRHVLSALLLHHRRLFEFGRDPQQNFVIFQHLVQLITPAQAPKIVALAQHLERVERFCG